jgi:hypothetical protein
MLLRSALAKHELMSINQHTTMILLGMIVAAATAASDVRERKRPSMPKITQSVLFGTPEADRILSALQVFPPENPWNQEIDRLTVRSNSARIIASIGADKHLGYNLDMNFVIVPPDHTTLTFWTARSSVAVTWALSTRASATSSIASQTTNRLRLRSTTVCAFQR